MLEWNLGVGARVKVCGGQRRSPGLQLELGIKVRGVVLRVFFI